MADVRALLRQQRTARRVDHPHAIYSDSGKLSCAVCREQVRPESAWDDHLKGAPHRQRVRAVQALQSHTIRDVDTTAPTSGHDTTMQTQKRRHSETEDDGDVEMGSDGGGDEDEPLRKKQHRVEGTAEANLPAGVKPTVEKPTIEIKSPIEAEEPSPPLGKGHEPRKLSLSTTPQLTPPLGRRSSGTPAQGVEMRIPSRPATPIAIKDSFLGGGAGSGSASGSNSGGLPSAASTPKIAPLGRSPLIPQEAQAQAQATTRTTTTIIEEEAAPGVAQAEIDEDEWAAFEAEVVNAPAPPVTSGTRPDMNGGLVASAPAVSAEELAVVEGDDEERSKRREAEEAKLEDEKEEATRALEDEFEDMQELESRVQKLKEKRELLRSQASRQELRPRQASAASAVSAVSAASAASSASAATLAPPAVLEGDAATVRRPSATMIDKENICQQLAATAAAEKGQPAEESDEDEDEDDDEDEGDWDAFRFR